MLAVIKVATKRGRIVQSHLALKITDATFKCTSSLNHVKYMSGVSTFEAMNNKRHTTETTPQKFEMDIIGIYGGDSLLR